MGPLPTISISDARLTKEGYYIEAYYNSANEALSPSSFTPSLDTTEEYIYVKYVELPSDPEQQVYVKIDGAWVVGQIFIKHANDWATGIVHTQPEGMWIQ